MTSWKFGVLGVLLGAVMVVGCDNSGGTKEPIPPSPIIDRGEDAGTTLTSDAGQTNTDAGTKSDGGTVIVVDAGTPDAGGNTTPDAGPIDAGTPTVDAGLAAIPFPATPGWQFYGPQDGLPAHVKGVTADEGGNIWIAGGEAGLFLIRSGSNTVEKFTMADGLRPYGYMADGGEPPGSKYLNVITVEGGPAGTVFVGYKAKGPNLKCEQDFDTPSTRDPSIYKSGDADKVTLTATGIKVVHYDIWTGPDNAGVSTHYPEGREKLCDIYNITWDKQHDVLWFGGNHGFAMGDPGFEGNPTCNGKWSCSGLVEHIHPLVTGFSDAARTNVVTLSGGYRAMALFPSGDVFVGADVRSTRFKWGTNGGSGLNSSSSWASKSNPYWTSMEQSENDTSNHFDFWPDAHSEPWAGDPKTDLVYGVANNGDDTFWVGSAAHGLAHVSAGGTVLGTLRNELVSPNVSRVTRDPSNGSIWVGARWGGGISRVSGGQVDKLGLTTFGVVANNPISDIQVMGSGSSRKMLVSFDSETGKGGAVGIYSGN